MSLSQVPLYCPTANHTAAPNCVHQRVACSQGSWLASATFTLTGFHYVRQERTQRIATWQRKDTPYSRCIPPSYPLILALVRYKVGLRLGPPLYRRRGRRR